jgi:hypothetical protein
LSFAGGERGLGPLANQTALLLGKSGIEVEHEGIGIGAKSATMNGTRCAISPEMNAGTEGPMGFSRRPCSG